MQNKITNMVAGKTGAWRIEKITAVTGQTLETAPRLDVVEGMLGPCEAAWKLQGFRSNTRYTARSEESSLLAIQAGLGRAEATRGSLIPIRKNSAWWALAQDERRAIFEEQSHHIATGLEYLPAIARRLYHSRDLGEAFDFLTWFEFAPKHEAEFDELLKRLRASREWEYVEREVDLRLTRA